MEIAALIVSLVAIGTALVSAFLAVRADRRQARAEQREQRRERREEAEATARRRGRPIVVPRGGSGGPTADRVRHDYMVRNAGEATITELWLWMEDGEGKVVSTRAGGVFAQAPGDAPARMAVEVPQPLPAKQVLMVQWRDSEGEHVEATGIEPPRHM